MLQFNAVESEKYKHCVCSDPLVPIYEGMVFNQTKGIPSSRSPEEPPVSEMSWSWIRSICDLDKVGLVRPVYLFLGVVHG